MRSCLVVDSSCETILEIPARSPKGELEVETGSLCSTRVCTFSEIEGLADNAYCWLGSGVVSTDAEVDEDITFA